MSDNVDRTGQVRVTALRAVHYRGAVKDQHGVYKKGDKFYIADGELKTFQNRHEFVQKETPRG